MNTPKRKTKFHNTKETTSATTRREPEEQMEIETNRQRNSGIMI